MKPKNKAFEVVVSQTFFVEAVDFAEARRTALECSVGRSGHCEYGGMKITSVVYNKKVNYNKGMPNSVANVLDKSEVEEKDPLENAEQDLAGIGCQMDDTDDWTDRGMLERYKKTHESPSLSGLEYWLECQGYMYGNEEILRMAQEDGIGGAIRTYNKPTAKKGCDNAIDTFKRTDRSIGKEQEYIDFGPSDGI
jgi:hypothetical protein